MPKRGENIYRRKDGRWEARYKKEGQTGKRVFGSVYAKSYVEVKEKLAKLQITEKKVKEKSQKLTVKKLTDSWLRKKQAVVKQSTYANYVSLIERHITAEIGNLSIEQFTARRLEQFVMQKLKYGRRKEEGGLSPKSVRDIIILLKSVFHFAEQKYKITNPMTTIELPKLVPKEARVLTREERKQLEIFAYATETDCCQLGLLLCLYTGIRLGELCALRWTDIQLETGLLKIQATIQRISTGSKIIGKKTKVIIDLPKSKSSIREIPLPDFLLRKLKTLALSTSPQAYFLSGKKDSFIEPRNYQNYFKACLKQNNLPLVNFHTLRHTFATHCIELGFDAKSLSQILGHADVNITLNRYVHSSLEHKRSQMKKLSLCL